MADPRSRTQPQAPESPRCHGSELKKLVQPSQQLIRCSPYGATYLQLTGQNSCEGTFQATLLLYLCFVPKFINCLTQCVPLASSSFLSVVLWLGIQENKIEHQCKDESCWRQCVRWHDLILNATEDLAKIVTLESGKPLLEAKAEVANGYVMKCLLAASDTVTIK